MFLLRLLQKNAREKELLVNKIPALRSCLNQLLKNFLLKNKQSSTPSLLLPT
jgi:hypothetical protein